MSSVKSWFLKYWWIPTAVIGAILALVILRPGPLKSLPIRIAKKADEVDKKKRKLDTERDEKVAALRLEYRETLKKLNAKETKRVDRYKSDPEKLARALERLAH